MKDLREIKAERDDKTWEELLEALRPREEQNLLVARLLDRLDRCGHFVYLGASSVADAASRFGISRKMVRLLIDVGRAVRLAPAFEEMLLEGKVTLENVSLAGKALGNPEYQREGDDWLTMAAALSEAQLRKLLKKRQQEARGEGDEPVLVAMFVEPSTEDDFHRARKIASRKAKRPLSDGETFKVVVKDYLDHNDPERVEPGTRRKPGTTAEDSRYIPEEVKREVIARQGERCAVEGCENTIFLEFMHILARMLGGSCEAPNLCLGCTSHHTQLDLGYIQIVQGPDCLIVVTQDGEYVGRLLGTEGMELPASDS